MDKETIDVLSWDHTNTNKPPMAPPNRTMKPHFGFGVILIETKQSKDTHALYAKKLDAYGQALNDHNKSVEK